MTVEALGDFGSRGDALVSFDARLGETVLESLPFEARLYRLRVQTSDFSGAAIAPAADDASTFDTLVLPLGTHCAAVTSGLPTLGAAAHVLLEGGDLLVAGGTGDSDGLLARRDVYRLDLARGRVRKGDEGMLVSRALALGVRVGSESWIVGGAQSVSEGSPSLDSFERYDSRSDAFDAFGRLAVPRARAGAVRLLDGSVLVAGGERTVGGEPLDSLERIASDGSQSRELDARLPWPAQNPVLLAGDDGFVWVAARVQEKLALALFDPASEQVEELELPRDDMELSPLVALPGARLAIIETRAGETTGVVHLLFPNGDREALDAWLTPFAGLSAAQAVALNDGRILLTGVVRGTPSSRVIDVGRREVRVRALDGVMRALYLRDDGAVAELSERGAHLLREDARTRYDNPGGTLLAADADAIALDAHTRWQREPLSLVSRVSGARFDLSLLRYERVTVELDVRGRAELILRREDGAERVIDISPTRVGPALCTLERAGEGALTLERDGEHVTLHVSGDSRRCRLESMVGPLALAVRALAQGVRVQNLVVTRE
jgi:hypothetical protein